MENLKNLKEKRGQNWKRKIKKWLRIGKKTGGETFNKRKSRWQNMEKREKTGGKTWEKRKHGCSKNMEKKKKQVAKHGKKEKGVKIFLKKQMVKFENL